MPDIVDSLHQKQAVLTHVIDGFLIEESLLPFPIASNVLANKNLNFIQKKQQEVLAQEKDQKHIGNNESSWMFQNEEEADMTTCEQCGFQGPRESFSSLKQRFCSLSCARRFAISHSKRSRSTKHSRQLLQVRRSAKGLKATSKTTFSHSHNRRYSSGTLFSPQEINPPSHVFSDSSFSECEDSNQTLSDDGSYFTLSPSPSPEPVLQEGGATPLLPVQWTVDDVWRYVHSLPGAEQHADEFRIQEIDGSALLLLHEEHLITSMNLPLGPALKLCAHIDRLREQASR